MMQSKSWRRAAHVFLFLLKKACYFPDSSFCTDHMRVELTLLLERSHRFGALGMESVCHSGRHTTRFNCCALNSPLPACLPALHSSSSSSQLTDWNGNS